jgi:hypothetical protein
MRPTPREELEGIRRILADVVAPAVTGEYPATVLQQVLLAMDRLAATWERAAPLLIAESDSIRELLGRLGSLLPGVAPPADLRNEPAATDFAGVEAENRSLRGALDAVIRALDSGTVADAAAVAEGRSAIGAALRANLDRALNT